MESTKFLIGSKIPNFDLEDVQGNSYNINSFENFKLLIIIFTCNHCPYAQAYEERIKQIKSDYEDKGVAVVAISSNDEIQYPEDSFEEMKKRAKEKKFNFPYLQDRTQEIAKAFDATHTPEIFLFNADRQLAFHGKIDDNWKDENAVQSKYLRNAIEELLEGKQVSVTETFTIGCTIKWKK